MMKEVRWKKNGEFVRKAVIGHVQMRCSQLWTQGGIWRWQARVSMCNLATSDRTGNPRNLLVNAKADAVRLAEELLIDYHESIVRELKLCGVEV